MQYRTMKKTGDRLSALGFGCMRLPETNGKIDEERATRQLRYAIDHGVNYLDTSWMYGNEAFIGRALAGGYREKVNIATKAPLFLIRKRDDMDRLLSEQLHNLQTDHVDYYHFHALTPAAWERLKGLGVIDFFARAKADGRIRHIGFSSHNSTVDFKKVVDAYDWDFCLIQFNILDETNQAGIEGLQYAASKGLGVVIMEPLRGGVLARPPTKEVQAIWDEADLGREEIKRSPAEWGLRWVWDHPEVTVVLSGMNEEAHIEENLRVAEEALPGSLTAQELALVDRVKDVYRRQIKVGCTGCHYCLPCPSGVNIPACFEYYNNMSSGSPMEERMKYVMFVGGGPDGSSPKGYASQCKGCQKCVSVCTQHIDIPAELKNVARQMEGLDTKALGLVFRPAMRAYTRYDRWRNNRKGQA